MASLRVVPLNALPNAFANEKGKLFEKLAAEMLRGQGYSISAQANVNYAGMEIDLEGSHNFSKSPFIAECKAHSTPIPAADVQRFLAKLVLRMADNARCHGIVLAVPSVSSEARGFVNEARAKLPHISLTVFEQEDIIHHLENVGAVPNEDRIRESDAIPKDMVAGDSVLVATEVGYFWVQLLLRTGDTTPSSALVVDAKGQPVPDGDLLRQMVDRVQELTGITLVVSPTSPAPDGARAYRERDADSLDEVATVRGSASWFEYQFPASPGFFVGREQTIAEAMRLLREVAAGTTSSRGMLLQGYSGWGKSSLILKLREAFEENDGLLVAVDCRAASTPYFALRAVDHALSQAASAGFAGIGHDPLRIGGMASLREALEAVNERLVAEGKWICIAFDQFEGIFSSPAILDNVVRLASIVTDLGGRVLLCFAWKTDLVGLTQEFPYQAREDLSSRCWVISLELFGESETVAILRALENELHTKLRKDLAFLLRESSQGYPWLLKKLCAHVLAERQAGIKQVQLATQMLRVRHLFESDLAGLSVPEEDALRHIARVAPVPFADVTEAVPVDALHSLIDKRLVVRVANKCDIYWDIFRDYLNTGSAPSEESFVLRSPVGSVLSALAKVAAAGREGVPLTPSAIGVTVKGTFYNVLRDLQLLGLVEVSGETVTLAFDLVSGQTLEATLERPLEKLRRHRLVGRLLAELESGDMLPIQAMADQMQRMCPYITADSRTWVVYARLFAKWLEIAQIIAFDRSSQTIRRFNRESDLRPSRARWHGPRRRKGPLIPEVRYKRIESALLDYGDAIAAGAKSWHPTRLTLAAWWQGFRMAVELGFTEQLEGNRIRLTSLGREFLDKPEERPRIFHTQAMSHIPAYAEFIRLLEEPGSTARSLSELGRSLSERLGVSWADSTAIWAAKNLNNWAKATGCRARRAAPSDAPVGPRLIDFPDV